MRRVVSLALRFFPLIAISGILYGQTGSLSLSSATGTTGGSVTLNLVLANSTPTGLQWIVTYSSADFSSVQISAGAAATAASKTLTCSSTTNGASVSYSCVLVGLANATTMGAGTVATYIFSIAASGSGTPASRNSQVVLSNTDGTTGGGNDLLTTASSGVVTIQKRQITVSPTSVSMYAPQTQQFTPSESVLWSISPVAGSITSGGLYTAPSLVAAQQTVTVTATSVADPGASATAAITLLPVSVTLAPLSVPLGASQTQQFTPTVTDTANTAVTWQLNPVVGTISGLGLYTAPSTVSGTQIVTVTATSVADPSKSGSATITLALPPGNVSVSPSSGAGSSQTFSFVYSDPLGFADISWVQMHLQTQLVANNACYLQYTRATNTIQLLNDAGSGFVGSGRTLGTAGSLANSQCTLDAGASSTSGSGNNLTVNLALSFPPAFIGSKTVNMGAIDNANLFSGWQAKGSWTVTEPGNLPPANVSVTPSSGAGSSQTFSLVYSDPYGFADINWVQMHFQTQLVANGACYMQYTRATNTIQLFNDAGSGYVGSGGTLGTAGTLANSQCTPDTGASSTSGSGNNLTVNLALSFPPAFIGAKTVSMGAINNAGVGSGWQAKGSWTVTQPGDLPPANVSVTPSSGTGSSQTFSFVYSDPYGFADISWVEMHLQTQLVANNACYLQYTRASNTIQLLNDAGSGFVGSGGTLGTAGTLSNSQCTLDTGASSSSGSGNNLTVNLALSFPAAFIGVKTISMAAINNAGVAAGWQAKGSWTVTGPGNLPPGNVSVTPSSGTGASQTFSFVYSDPYGFADINWVQMHFQTQLVANGACYMQYTRATNTIQLFNDAGSGFVGSGGTLGTAGTLSNSQCTLDMGASSTSGSGNNLTVNLALSFPPAFSGSKNVSMGAINNANVFSGWQAMGTWTPH